MVGEVRARLGMSTGGAIRRVLGVSALAAVLQAGCSPERGARDLSDLVLQDSTYFAPETMEPFTGRIFRAFPDDTTRREIEGELLDGEWHGELVVYHTSGRVRYMGSFAHGNRCGPWTENTQDREPVNMYDELVSEIETLGMYPPCPPDS